MPVTEVTVNLTPTSDGSGVKWVLNSELEDKQQLVVFGFFDGGVVVSNVFDAKGVAYGDGGLQKGDLLLRFEGEVVTTSLPKPKEGAAPRPYKFVVRRIENGGTRTAHEKMRFEPVIAGSSDNGRRFGKQVHHNMSMILDRNANANLTNSGL